MAVLTTYYRRNLLVPEAMPLCARDPGHSRTVRVGVGESADSDVPTQVVEVRVVDFAAHVAYLEPVTGMGLMVEPRPESDIAPAPWVERVTWDGDPVVALSLHSADRAHALQRLARAGWTLLEGESDSSELAGRTEDGLRAIYLYANRTADGPLVLEDFHAAFTALRGAARLHNAA